MARDHTAYMRVWNARHRTRLLAAVRAKRAIPLTQDDLDQASVRFWAKVDMSGECWLWMGVRMWGGYGRFAIKYRFLAAHRYAVQSMGRDLPDGMTVDHLCFNKLCVRPSHLDVVSMAENIRRSHRFRHALPCSCGQRNVWRKGLCGTCYTAQKAAA